MDKKFQDNLHREAKTLFEQGKVNQVIGFEAGTVKFATTPVVINSQDDVERLVINPFITNNLSKMLIKLKGKTAVIVKGCDSRSVVSLVQDHKINREDIVILGVPCGGIVDVNKVARSIGKDRDEIDDIVVAADKVTVTSGSDKKEIPLKEAVYEHCLSCEVSTPKEFDILLGEAVVPPVDKGAGKQKIDELEKMTLQERWQYWKEQMQKCTRCYACRNVCPSCYCERCFVEESEPQWIQSVPTWQDNLVFQVIRNLHVAGRCTDCGNCERACPAGIPLRNLTKKMYDIVDEEFKYKAGTDKDSPPLMASYETQEAEELIR